MDQEHHFARLLGANPFFAGLGCEAVNAIASLCLTRRLEPGEVLFLKGDPGDALYALRRGQIRISAGTSTGKQITFNLLGPGDIFGEVALLDGQPRTADAIAEEVCDLFMLRRRDFFELVKRNQELAIRIIDLLCERIRWMSIRMEETALMPLSARLARRLIALREDYGIELQVSQEALAVFVGASRESVNRQLQAWRRRGWIELGRSRIRLIDCRALASETAAGIA